MRRAVIAACAAALGLEACGSDDPAPREPERLAPARDAAPAVPDGGTRRGHDVAPAVPDGGTRRGHDAPGGEDGREATRPSGLVTVPEVDRTPPSARLVVLLDAVEGRNPLARTTPRDRPRTLRADRAVRGVRAYGIAQDGDGGVARVRLSVRATVTCRTREGRTATRAFRRHFPPPAIARQRIPAGVPVPARRSRRSDLGVACARGDLLRARGMAWADATNAHELESSSAPVRFAFAG